MSATGIEYRSWFLGFFFAQCLWIVMFILRSRKAEIIIILVLKKIHHFYKPVSAARSRRTNEKMNSSKWRPSKKCQRFFRNYIWIERSGKWKIGHHASFIMYFFGAAILYSDPVGTPRWCFVSFTDWTTRLILGDFFIIFLTIARNMAGERKLIRTRRDPTTYWEIKNYDVHINNLLFTKRFPIMFCTRRCTSFGVIIWSYQ